MKIKTSQARDQANAAYTNYMQMQLKDKAPIRAKTTDQAESTKRLLSLSEAELEEYRARPVPAEAQCRDELGNVALNERKIDGELWSLIDGPRGLRRQAKNETGDAVSQGLSGTTPERHAASVEACMKTTAKLDPLEKYKIKRGFVPLSEESTPKEGIFSRLLGKIKAQFVPTELPNWRDWVDKDD